MTRYTDGKRTIEISITGKNGIDWENDFYNGGNGFMDTDDGIVYLVDDVDYLIEQAEDLFNGVGDYYSEEPTHDEVFICEGGKVLVHLIPEED